MFFIAVFLLSFVSLTSKVVVFDLDGTLCSRNTVRYLKLAEELANQFKKFNRCSECITYQTFDRKYSNYFFLPYLDVLFNFLIENNFKIVFFSAGGIDRNRVVISTLLKNIFSEFKYAELKKVGHFLIYSYDDISARYKKIEHLLCEKYSVSIDDIILIEDVCEFSHPDERPCLMVLKSYNRFDNILFTDITESLNLMINDAVCYEKNFSFYFIGIFQTYLNQYSDQKLKSGLKSLFADLADFDYETFKLVVDDANEQLFLGLEDFTQNKDFQFDMIDLGFREVIKSHPKASKFQA